MEMENFQRECSQTWGRSTQERARKDWHQITTRQNVQTCQPREWLLHRCCESFPARIGHIKYLDFRDTVGPSAPTRVQQPCYPTAGPALSVCQSSALVLQAELARCPARPT